VHHALRLHSPGTFGKTFHFMRQIFLHLGVDI